jgi:hypothetical protein
MIQGWFVNHATDLLGKNSESNSCRWKLSIADKKHCYQSGAGGKGQAKKSLRRIKMTFIKN